MDNNLIKKALIYHYLDNPEDNNPPVLKEYHNMPDYQKINKICLEEISVINAIVKISALIPEKARPKEQVSASLNQIYKIKEKIIDEKLRYEIFNSYVEKKFYAAWNKIDKKFKKHYIECQEKIRGSKDYFLSYTNRNAATTNTIFKEVINDTDIDRKRNKLAALIAEKLHNQNLRGFYDYHSMKCGEEIEDKVFEDCQQTVCFIQLIEEKSWTIVPGIPNWCYKEYTFFKDKVDKESYQDVNREFFIVQDATALQCANPNPVKDWYDRIGDVKGIKGLPKRRIRKFDKKMNALAKEVKENIDKYIALTINRGI